MTWLKLTTGFQFYYLQLEMIEQPRDHGNSRASVIYEKPLSEMKLTCNTTVLESFNQPLYLNSRMALLLGSKYIFRSVPKKSKKLLS